MACNSAGPPHVQQLDVAEDVRVQDMGLWVNWGTLFGVPIIGIVVFWGLDRGPPIYGNCHMVGYQNLPNIAWPYCLRFSKMDNDLDNLPLDSLIGGPHYGPKGFRLHCLGLRGT